MSVAGTDVAGLDVAGSVGGTGVAVTSTVGGGLPGVSEAPGVGAMAEVAVGLGTGPGLPAGTDVAVGPGVGISGGRACGTISG